jgi:hypothetical protein
MKGNDAGDGGDGLGCIARNSARAFPSNGKTRHHRHCRQQPIAPPAASRSDGSDDSLILETNDHVLKLKGDYDGNGYLWSRTK